MQYQDQEDHLLGRELGGYRLTEAAGEGGTGRVYKATDGTGAFVAVKVLMRNQFSEASLSAWRREARLVGRIEHANLIKVLAADRTNEFDYCIYEWAEHGSLADLIRSRTLPPIEIAEIVSKVALGCAALHDRRILHRDIKPSNVLVDARGEIKLADFGAARAVDETLISDSVGCIGTPGYMSPEQLGLIDAPVGEATDVYALGVVLYSMLAGRGPFAGGSTIEVIAKSARGMFEKPSVFRSIPEPLERICLKCLERDPSDRYPSVTALYDDLRNFRDGKVVQARAVRLPQRSVFRFRRQTAAVALCFGAALLAMVLWPRTSELKQETVANGPTIAPDSPWFSTQFDEQQALDKIEQLGGIIKTREVQVVAVNLNNTPVVDDDLRYLTAFTQLDAVLLEMTNISIAGVQQLPENIRRLDLGGTLIRDEDCGYLADRTKLTSISFGGSPISDYGVGQLCKNKQLVELTLQEASITDAALDYIANCDQLESLVLNRCTELTARAIEKLAKCHKLKYLHLGQTGVDDRALAKILENCDLIEIGLCECPGISDSTMDTILLCESLEEIYLDGSAVSTTGLAKLNKLPKIRRILARGNNIDVTSLEVKFGNRVAFVTNW